MSRLGQDREWNRNEEDDGRPSRSFSVGGYADIRPEHQRVPSRQNIQDSRTPRRQSQSPESKGSSHLSSPKVGSDNWPISPKSGPPGPRMTKSVASALSSSLTSEVPIVDRVVEESNARLNAHLPGNSASKDPRLRKSSTKMTLNSETDFVNSKVAETQTKGRTEGTDVAMTDVHQVLAMVSPADQDSVRSPHRDAASPDLMETFVKLMTDFADQVSTMSALRYKKDIVKQKVLRHRKNDRINHENCRVHPATIEQGIQARQLAERELGSVDQKLNEHVKVQRELAQKLAKTFVTQIEQHRSAQESSPEMTTKFQNNLDRVEALSVTMANTSEEVKQLKLNTTKLNQEVYKLVERAASPCKEAQEAAKKMITQVNDVNQKLTAQKAANMENQVQIGKVQRIMGHLENEVEDLKQGDMVSLRNRMGDAQRDIDLLNDDIKHVRKRTKNVEEDVQSLRSVKAQSSTVEGMRSDFKEDVAQVRRNYSNLTSQVRLLEAGLKDSVQRYDSLTPKVEKHHKKIEELCVSAESSRAGEQDSIGSVAILKQFAQMDERFESLTNGVQSDITEMRQSFQDVRQKLETSATQSGLVALRDSVGRLEAQVAGINAIGILEALNAHRRDAEADRNNLKGLEKEVDELYTLQAGIGETFTGQNERISARINTAETIIKVLQAELNEVSEKFGKDIQEMSATLTEKARGEAQRVAQQIGDIFKRLEVTTAAATARPTPPSISPTPQIHQSSYPTAGEPSSPAIDGAAITARFNELAHKLTNLSIYVNSQFSGLPSLSATINSHTQSILNLQSRWNSLTTKSVVRDMVQQMKLMYPYAPTVQHDIGNLQNAVSELGKLPSVVAQLKAQINSLSDGIAKLEQNTTGQEQEGIPNNGKHERLVALVKEERDNLKQHVQQQHEELKQHVNEQCNNLGVSLDSLREGSVSSAGEVAAKMRQLEQMAASLLAGTQPERSSELNEDEATRKAAAQLQVNGPPWSGESSENRGISSPVATGNSDESDHAAMLKKFDASTRGNMVAPPIFIADPNSDFDSDTPLMGNRMKASRRVPAASVKEDTPVTPGKRKRTQDKAEGHEGDRHVPDHSGSSSKRKAYRRF